MTTTPPKLTVRRFIYILLFSWGCAVTLREVLMLIGHPNETLAHIVYGHMVGWMCSAYFPRQR